MGSSPDEKAALHRARHVLGAAQGYQRAEVSSLRGRQDFLALALLVVGAYAVIALLVHHFFPNVLTLVAVIGTLATGVFTFCKLAAAVVRLRQARRRQRQQPRGDGAVTAGQ